MVYQIDNVLLGIPPTLEMKQFPNYVTKNILTIQTPSKKYEIPLNEIKGVKVIHNIPFYNKL